MQLMVIVSLCNDEMSPESLRSEFETYGFPGDDADGVTGILFCDRRRCLEVIEGSAAAVRRRYDAIANDVRFTEAQILLDEPVERRSLSGRRVDSFLVEFSDLVEPKTIACLRTLYDLHFPMSGAGFVTFVEDTIDVLDRHWILQSSAKE